MLVGYGWCVLRSSRDPYRGATVTSVDAIDDSVDAADRQLWDDFRRWMASQEEPFIKWALHEQNNNHRGVLIYCVSRNHRSSAVWDMLKWIARNGSGSYGLLFVHDDEDLIDNHSYGRGNVDHSNVFRVHRIANGQLSEMSDPFFGPIVPNLHPSELA